MKKCLRIGIGLYETYRMWTVSIQIDGLPLLKTLANVVQPCAEITPTSLNPAVWYVEHPKTSKVGFNVTSPIDGILPGEIEDTL